MANLCDNIFYASSNNRHNIEVIIDFFTNWPYADIEDSGSSVDIYFESRWEFPEEEMDKLYETIPNKEDVFMRCLSVEYGNLYHALWICDGDGWREV